MTISISTPTSNTGSIQNNSTDVLTVDSSNNITVTNNLSVSGTTTSTGAIIGTSGIYLGGTDAANLLDDYEYGTWTPNVYHFSSNNSTWATKYGRYIKIGDQVTCWFMCDAGNSGTAGSVLTVGTLPFTIGGSADTLPYGACGIWGANGPSPQDGNVFIIPSVNYVRLFNGGTNVVTQATFATGTFTYRIAS